jgi:dihydrofolate reductase
VTQRKIIVNIATSADGYVARPDGNLDWLTNRPAPKGRQPPPASVPAGVHFVTESIAAFAEHLRGQAGKNVWMMGGGEIIASFLDEGAIDEFIITVVPTFIGEGIPLLAPRHREVALRLLGVHQFPDGVVQLHYAVQRSSV